MVNAYLFVMLTWARKQGVSLPPELERYADALSERAAIKKALEMEGGRGRPGELFAHSSSAEHERGIAGCAPEHVQRRRDLTYFAKRVCRSSANARQASTVVKMPTTLLC